MNAEFLDLSRQECSSGRKRSPAMKGGTSLPRDAWYFDDGSVIIQTQLQLS